MCGIIGYVGPQQATSILLDGLKRLEYRGYDSAGVAVHDQNKFTIVRAVGKLGNLEKKLKDTPTKGSTGLAHCLTGDTLIQLADGRVVRIDSLQGDVEVVSLDLATQKLSNRRAKVWSHKAPKELIEIKAPFGSIVCTPEHRMFIADETGALVERFAHQIKPGDLIAHVNEWRCEGRPISFQGVANIPRYYRLSETTRNHLVSNIKQAGCRKTALSSGVSEAAVGHLRDATRNVSEVVLQAVSGSFGMSFPLAGAEPVHSIHGNFVELPKTSTVGLMRFLGYMLGDGHVGRRGVRFKDPAQDTLEAYAKIIQQEFNLEPRIVPIPDVNAELLEVNSTNLADWLRLNVLERREQFLDQVGGLPDDQLAGFLRGLFDAEGYVAGLSRQIGFAMINREFVKRIQLWLLRFGIVGAYSEREPDLKHRRPNRAGLLLLSGVDAAINFQAKVGFTSKRKQDALRELMLGERGASWSSRAVPYPKQKTLNALRAAGVPGEVIQPFSQGERLRDRLATELVEVLRPHEQAQHIRNELEQRLSAEVRYQEVKSVKTVSSSDVAPDGLVYDLEVPGVENFFANGILSHNSRWATHGRPSEENAHPHQSGDVVVIHNGIIENHLELKAELLEKGRVFSSETDTEICAHLIDDAIKSGKKPLEAVRASLARVRGAYALVIAFESNPNILIVAKTASPMVLGVGKGENFVASDVPALLPYTRDVIYLDEGEIAVLTADKIEIENAKGEPVQRQPKHITWSSVMAEKDGYKHFMLKEIFEQPRAITDTLRGRISLESGDVILGEEFISEEKIKKLRRIVIVACGTSWHAGLVGKYLIESMARIPVEVDLASEFRYRDPLVGEDDLVLAISQSGETADTLAAIVEAKKRGASIVSICNVVDSSIPRASDGVLYTHAGPEIGVASTKAFTTQMAALYLLGVYFGRRRGTLQAERARGYLQSLSQVPQWIEDLLKQAPSCFEIGKIISHCQDALYLGRGLQVAIALEGALKLKEISYVHAEGYPGGEMKHGPIALITNTMPIIAMATKHESYDKMLSNLQEVRAREGRLFCIATQGDTALEKLSEKVLYIPVAERVVEPFLTVIFMQLIAYYTADIKGTDVDQPRNLAKSVTVE